jgi:hypothetical protein
MLAMWSIKDLEKEYRGEGRNSEGAFSKKRRQYLRCFIVQKDLVHPFVLSPKE